MKLDTRNVDIFLIRTLGIAVTLSGGAMGATITWDGNGDGTTYEDGGNWGGTVPTNDLSTDVAQFIGGTVDLSTTRQVSGLHYASATTLSGTGSLEIGDDGILVAGDSWLSTEGVVFNQPNTTITLAGGRLSWGPSAVVSGTGAVTVTGGDVLYVDGTANTYEGGTTITGGARVSFRGDINAVGGLGTGDIIIDNGILTNNDANQSIFDRNIEIGAGGATMYTFQGGYLSLRDNTFLTGSGTLTIESGTNNQIFVDADNSATFSGDVVITGGNANLTVKSQSLTLDSGTANLTLNDGGTLQANGNIGLDNRSIIVSGTGGTIQTGNRNVAMVNSALSGSAPLTISGGGSASINTAGNTHSGGVLLDDVQMNLFTPDADALGVGTITLDNEAIIKNSDNLPIINNDVVIGAGGGNLVAGWSKNLTVNGVVSGSGVLTILSDSGSVVLSNTANTFSGDVVVNSNGSALSDLIVGSLESGSYGGVISGDGDVEFDMSGGTQVLTGTNTNTGEIVVGPGTLDLGGSTADGSLDSASLIMAGGTLDYTRTGNTTQSFASTEVSGGSSAITAVAGNTVALGLLTHTAGSVDFSSGAGTITTSTANDSTGILGGWATFDGGNWAVNNGSDVIVGFAGPYTLTSAAGMTAANYASQNIDVDNSAGLLDGTITPNTLRFNSAGANTLELAAGANEIESGGILVTSNVGSNLSSITGGDLTGAAGSDLVITQNNTSDGLTISSAIVDNGGTSLTKSGDGLVTLTGANTYAGITTVGAGRLVFVDGKAVNPTYVTDGDLEFNVTTGVQQLQNGSISGSGNLIKTGAGQLWLGGNGQPQEIALGGNSVIDVQAGMLRNEYGNSAWGNNLADLHVEEFAEFDLWDGDTQVDALTGAGTIDHGRPGTNTLTIGVNGGGDDFTGVIVDSVALTKVGSGTQILSGNSTYFGTTTISDGVLQIGNGGETGDLNDNSPIINNSVLAFNRSNTYTVGETISGTGSLELTAGSGDSAITKANSYEGGTTITSGASGRFRLSGDAALGAADGALTLNGGGIKNSANSVALNPLRTVVLGAAGGRMQAGWGPNNFLAIEGVIEGAGDLVIEGDSGRSILSGTNTYTGQTIVQNGARLFMNGDSSAASGLVSVEDGGTLGGVGIIGGPVNVSADGVLAPGDSAVGTLSTTGDVDISALAGGTGTLDFELNALTGPNDLLDIGGTLTIGSGVLGLSDFTFTDLGGFEVGTYTLIFSNGITGALDGSDITGSVSGIDVTLQINGNNIELVVASAASDYDTWADTFLPDDVSNPIGDNDGDGLLNEDEYAFGLDPTSGSSVNAIAVPLDKAAGTFSYTRRDPASTGLSYAIWTSQDLDTWIEDETAVQTPSLTDGDGNQTVAVTLSAAPSSDTFFVRVISSAAEE